VALHIDHDVFSKLIDLLPIIQETALECLERELNLYKHDRSRMFMEREGIMRFFRFLQRKWALDIIYILLIQGELHFNEIRRILEGISSRTLTDRLSEMEERGIITRAVHQDKPVKVIYSLTDYGRGLAALFVPVLFYGLSYKTP
jgi:DNA-binding HxlR family transcriptional regulator